MHNIIPASISAFLFFYSAEMWTPSMRASNLYALVENQVDAHATLDERAKVLARAVLKVEVIKPVPIRVGEGLPGVYRLDPSPEIRSGIARRLNFDAFEIIGPRIQVFHRREIDPDGTEWPDGPYSVMSVHPSMLLWPLDGTGQVLKAPIRISVDDGNFSRFKVAGTRSYGPLYAYSRFQIASEGLADFEMPFIVCIDFDGPPARIHGSGESIVGYVVWGDIIDLDRRRPVAEKP